MQKDLKIKVPRYKQIALDLASRIANGELKEGTKVFGRSSLAGEYNVSPETIRRAVILLEDMEVVTASAGSGVLIDSRRNAHKFVDSYQSKESISSLREEIVALLDQKKSIEHEIMGIIDKIIDYSDRLKSTNPMNPMEIPLIPNSKLIGKSISESKFWQNTGATIVGIRRGKEIIFSPGPHMEFEQGDRILAVGDQEIIERAKNYMKTI